MPALVSPKHRVDLTPTLTIMRPLPLEVLITRTAAPEYTFQHTFPAAFSTAVPSPPPRVPFADTANTANAASAPRRNRRRNVNENENANRNARSRRRVASTSNSAPAPAVFGVGPSTANAATIAASESISHPSLPSTNLGSLLDKPTTSGAAATDVWYFVLGVHSSVALDSLPEKSEMTEKRPDKEFSHLACRLCGVWRNIVTLRRLKGRETAGSSTNLTPGEREEFSLPGFYARSRRRQFGSDRWIEFINSMADPS
ncbi:hypothetical protein K438DRAFT_1993386 [Mycena galopus ATCC 62051]|nr:hypothetical protein K438DRAFT_1993386 [Mycena galopus ATCC 62051]